MILKERVFGLTKSYIAIRSPRQLRVLFHVIGAAIVIGW